MIEGTLISRFRSRPRVVPGKCHVHPEVAADGVLRYIDGFAGEADHDAVAVRIAPGDDVVLHRCLELELADVRAVLLVLRVPERDAADLDAIAGKHGHVERGLIVFSVALVVTGHVSIARERRNGQQQDHANPKGGTWEHCFPGPYIDDIEFRNSEFVRVFSSFSTSSSIDSTVDNGEKTLRSTQIRLSSLRSRRSSSLRVPDLLMSIAGKTRLSESLRSRCTSMLPVPLNSSKITSSMREPVSISAVAMIVSEPPSSTLRAEPKKRFGRCRALESTPPESTLPDGGTTVL